MNKIIIAVLSGLLIIALGSAVYFYQKAHIDPQQEAIKDLQHTIALVSRHLVLPEGETPTLATVSDPEKLKDQPFFARAKKGNKVLIFSVSQKAILYDPVLDKIIEVAPINLQSGATVE
jgi:hypothetical protein